MKIMNSLLSQAASAINGGDKIEALACITQALQFIRAPAIAEPDEEAESIDECIEV